MVVYAMKGVIPNHHHHHLVGSKKNLSSLPKNRSNWVLTLLHESLSTLTRVIQPKKAVGESVSLAYGLNSLTVKYYDPTMDLREAPINSTLKWTCPKLNSFKYLALTTRSGNSSS